MSRRHECIATLVEITSSVAIEEARNIDERAEIEIARHADDDVVTAMATAIPCEVEQRESSAIVVVQGDVSLSMIDNDPMAHIHVVWLRDPQSIKMFYEFIDKIAPVASLAGKKMQSDIDGANIFNLRAGQRAQRREEHRAERAERRADRAERRTERLNRNERRQANLWKRQA